MENAFRDPKVYFEGEELNQKHEDANSSSLSTVCCKIVFLFELNFNEHLVFNFPIQFKNQKKLGRQSLISKWEKKLIDANRQQFAEYQEINEYREKLFSPSIWKKKLGAIWKLISGAIFTVFCIDTKFLAAAICTVIIAIILAPLAVLMKIAITVLLAIFTLLSLPLRNLVEKWF